MMTKFLGGIGKINFGMQPLQTQAIACLLIKGEDSSFIPHLKPLFCGAADTNGRNGFRLIENNTTCTLFYAFRGVPSGFCANLSPEY